MSMEHIRKNYGVPARRGRRVRYTDPRGYIFEGKITSTINGHIRVLVDDRAPGYKGRLILHPTWNIEYL